MNFEGLFRSPDLFRKGWEEKWPQIGADEDGGELRADCQLTLEEARTIMRAGDVRKEGTLPTTHELYEIKQLRGHFGDAQVMKIYRLSSD